MSRNCSDDARPVPSRQRAGGEPLDGAADGAAHLGGGAAGEPAAEDERAAHDNLAVLLLYMGGPDSPESIRPFLHNLFADRQIIRLPGGRPGQRALSWLISRVRAPKVARRYARIGGFPLQDHSRAQAQALQEELDRRRPGGRHQVSLAFRYWHPYLENALSTLATSGFTKLVALSLYPQYSKSTSGSSLAQLFRAVVNQSQRFELRVVDRFSGEPGFVRLLTRRISEGLERWPAERRGSVTVVLSAHSVPQELIDAGDPYADEIRELEAALRHELAQHPARPELRLGYQSRSGPVRWLGPDVDEVVRELLAQGRRDLLLAPVSFVSDHLETLFELDLQYKARWLAAGAERVERTSMFNESADFIELLADLVESAAAAPARTVEQISASGG